jgi:hypothetical protein
MLRSSSRGLSSANAVRRGRHRFAWSLLAFGCLLTAACSYIIELPSTTVSIPLVDGGGGDVAALDANLYVDPDAEPLPPPPPFCASRQSPSLFCEDFDEGGGPVLADSGTVQTNLGALQVVNAIALSPPRSLVATATGNEASALFVPTLSEKAPQLAASASILLSTFTSTSADLMQIELTPNVADGGTGRCFARLTATTTWAVTQVCTDGDVETAKVVTDSGRPVERRQWRKFVLALTALGTFTLTIDDALVVHVTAVDPMFPAPSPQAVGFGIERSASGSLAVFYDNLLVTQAP